MSFRDDIRRTRFHDFAVSVGKEAKVATVRQTRHDFGFGSNIFGLIRNPDEAFTTRYKEAITDLWSFGTLPFYWGRYEPEEGRPMEEATREAARWAAKSRLTTKGHPLCWHTVCADWLLAYDNDTILGKQLDRIRREVGHFAGEIDMWDVINEVVIMPIFDKYDNAVTRIANQIGAEELTVRCFAAAKEANPNATLLINDFNLTEQYEKLIERLLDKGCPIDAIGLQTHQHQGYHGVEYTLDVIDRFSRFGKPLHFTETTILSGHAVPKEITDLNDYKIDTWPSTPELEEAQRRQVEEYYSAVFSRPETAALIWWDMQDGNWLGAPSGLLRRDLSPKPAYDRLKELIKGEWWYGERELPVQSDGALHFTGPAGDYEVTVNGQIHPVRLAATLPTASLTKRP